MVILNRALLHIRVPLLFDFCHMIRHAPEHLLHGFGGLAIIPAADVALHQHLAGIVRQIRLAAIPWAWEAWEAIRCYFRQIGVVGLLCHKTLSSDTEFCQS